VDSALVTSHPDVYAAGDIAEAEHPTFGGRIRVGAVVDLEVLTDPSVNPEDWTAPACRWSSDRPSATPLPIRTQFRGWCARDAGQLEPLVDGTAVAEGHIPLFTMAAFNETNAGLTCGYELGPAVGEGYRAPFRCTAAIRSATITLSEHAPINPLVEFERIMAEQ
jgi:hypothetical protein